MVLSSQDTDWRSLSNHVDWPLLKLALHLPHVKMHLAIPTMREPTEDVTENVWTIGASQGGPLNKSYQISNGDVWNKVASPPKVSKWRYAEAETPNLECMRELLEHAAEHKRICFLRAALHPAADLAHGIFRRRWHKRFRRHEDGKSGPLIDVPRRWIVLDIDEVTLPDALSYKNPENILDWLSCTLLPSPFCNVSFVWQFSGSAGLKTTPGNDLTARKLKVHLFLKTKQAINCRDFEEILKERKFSVIDRACSRGAQIIYTARPELTGGEDPLKQRIGIYQGKSPDVDFSQELEALRKRLPKLIKVQEVRKRSPRGALLEPSQCYARADVASGQTPYDRTLLRIAYNELGADRDGYYNPIFKMISAGVRSGEHDFERLKREIKILVWARLDALDDQHKTSDVARYLSDEMLDQAIANSVTFWSGESNP